MGLSWAQLRMVLEGKDLVEFLGLGESSEKTFVFSTHGVYAIYLTFIIIDHPPMDRLEH